MREGRSTIIGQAEEPERCFRHAEVIAATGSKSELAYAPLPQDDPRQRQPDISRARELLAWQPAIALGEGLKRTIDDFKARVC